MARRRSRAEAEETDEAVPGYPAGQDSPRRAAQAAMSGLDGARWGVIVEGVSDQIAVETAAGRLGRSLPSEGVVVVPIGGAQAAGRFVAEHVLTTSGVRLAALCDEAEEGVFRRALSGGTAHGRMAVFVCRPDLEGEMIRAVPRERIEAILAAEGDLRSFRTLQRQPAWRDAAFSAQMGRFLGAGARRKARYARLLVDRVDVARLPRPLSDVLAHVEPA